VLSTLDFLWDERGVILSGTKAVFLTGVEVSSRSEGWSDLTGAVAVRGRVCEWVPDVVVFVVAVGVVVVVAVTAAAASRGVMGVFAVRLEASAGFKGRP